MSVKVDRKRKIPVTTLLRAVGYEQNDEIAALFTGVDVDRDHQYIAATLDKDLTHTQDEALIEFYKKLRPGDPPTGDNARQLVEPCSSTSAATTWAGSAATSSTRARLGRRAPRRRAAARGRTITREDIVAIVGRLIDCNRAPPDDIDHLGNRRVRAVGELIQNAVPHRPAAHGARRAERMSIQDADPATPSALINIRPVVAAMSEFFGGSQLRQFMDQTNPLAELTHKRRLSALGPGWSVAAIAPASTCATCTTATTVASARSRRRKARTSV